MTQSSITFRKPWDAHRHLRDGTMLQSVAKPSADDYWGGIIMPNLVPPVVTAEDALDYCERIEQALGDTNFQPSMTLYLTDNTNPDDVALAFESLAADAVKLYPLHGTTNSDMAVTNLMHVDEVLKMMSEIGMPLLIHGEEAQQHDGPVDHYDREAKFLREKVDRILEGYPDLRVSLEHISSQEAAEFMRKHGSKNLVATITPQHLYTNRRFTIYNADAACMPIIKAERHMLALRELVKDCPWVHLGTDCAPHFEGAKQAVLCACGCYTDPHSIAMYLQAFEEADALDQFEEFASVRGPRFFGLEPSEESVTYIKEDWQLEGMLEIFDPDDKRSVGLVRPFGLRLPQEQGHGQEDITLRWKKTA